MRNSIEKAHLGSKLFPRDLLDPLLRALGSETAGAEPHAVVCRDEHSNDLAEVHFDDGRPLMVKRARHPWAAAQYQASRAAARLLRKRTGVVGPQHVDVPVDLDDRPVEAYWRIPLPTLRELWPRVPERARPAVLRSWGRLIRRVHGVKLVGHGPLPEAIREASSLAGFLEGDLEARLLPAVRATWPAGLSAVERLIEAIPEVAAHVGDLRGVLIHNDLHMANVLCRVEGQTVRCVGVLDLEAAFSGPVEADLARIRVLHGPLFGQPLPDPWFERVRDGYGDMLDPLVLTFFRAYHLVNIGFHAALVGYAAHAADVARAAAREAGALEAVAEVLAC